MTDTLQRRVKAQMTRERRQLHAEQMRLARRRVVLGGQAAKALGTASRTVDDLVDRASATANVQRASTSLGALGRRMRELIVVNEQAAVNAKKLAALERRGELARRMRLARSLGATDEPMIGKDAAEVVLLHAGKPQRIEDITRRVLETGLIRNPKGATPVQTISSYLARAAVEGDRFVRVGPGTYDLLQKQRSTA